MTRIKVRKDNDFVFLWSIERCGAPEDLNSALEKRLYLHASNSRYEDDVEIESYTVNGNILRIEFTPELVPHTGNYDFVFKYTLPDLSLSDDERKCAVDIEALTIVDKSSKADKISEISATSDLLIGLKGASAYQVWLDAGNTGTVEDYLADIKGDPFLYEDFTPEQLEALKGDDGESAYEIWLLLGNVGTEQDFIDSLAAGGVDLTSYLKITDATNTYQPKGNYLESETDPTVPDWAKQASKPTYGVNEIIGLDTALSGKVDNERVLTDVPANAKFTDTIYTHPATHSIEEVSGLQTALDSKVDDSQVLSNVPAGAVFTDTIYTHPDSHPASIITQDANNRFVTDAEKTAWNAKASTDIATTLLDGLMSSEDKTKLDGIATGANNYTHPATHSISEVSGLQAELDNKVDDSQVLTNVPSGALFTDTVYTHPESHPATIISQDATHRFVTDTEKTTWSGKADAIHNHDDRYYTEGEVDGLISAIKGAYDAELVTSPTTGTLTLKQATETVLDGALTTSNVFTVALPTPVSGKVNESVLIFKIGATLPTITQPSGIVWRGKVPALAINTSWTIVYEQINTTGSTYEIWAVAVKNA